MRPSGSRPAGHKLTGLSTRPPAAGPCCAPPTVPAPVLAIADGRQHRLAWQNESALTYELGAGEDRCFVKWCPVSSSLDLADEADRLAWAVEFTPVPVMLGRGSDADGSWIVTAALPGRNAVDPRWTAEPRTAVHAIGEGLRAMHESLPVERCPFSWTTGLRLDRSRRAAAAGRLDPARDWQPEHQQLSISQALELLSEIPPTDQPVVCHGDACAPNTLLTDDGRWSGHVDLGALGVADRWADLAIATWSTGWNYGPGWEDELLAAYGIQPDPDRTRYYRLLWDLDG
jgi:aminoglycoside phosphotransferase